MKYFCPLYKESFFRRDLAALNIMRGRDNGLADYNTVRKCFGFPMINNFSEINHEQFKKHPDMFRKYKTKFVELYSKFTNKTIFRLEEAYGNNMMNIDLYVGGMLESYGGPGPLFTKIIQQQFERLRDADRFWFENKENGLFTAEEVKNN